MTHIVRYMGMVVVTALWLVAVSGGDDAEPAAVEAATTDAVTTANPQAGDEGKNAGSATSDAPADEGDAAAGEPGAGADGASQQNEPAENEPTDAEAEPSAEDQAFLQDPFSYLQSDMQSATMDLREGQTTPPADVTQPRILHRLGLLIEQLERQGSGAGQAGQRVNRPAEQSSLMRGPGGQNEMRAPRDDGRDWADLSPKERQKILQSKTDGFPAGYDDILADYFRQVARAQQDDVGASSAAEATGEPPPAPAEEGGD
jgi:hypothetical protein